MSAAEVDAASFTVCSQNGEDGVLAHVLAEVPHALTSLEIGASLGPHGDLECNTEYLVRQGWHGVILDREPLPFAHTHRETVNAENLAALLEKYAVPADLGVLSIDVDGIDYHLWAALPEAYRPAVVMIEYNAGLAPDMPLTVPYDRDFPAWCGSSWYGASAAAMLFLAARKGYRLVANVARLNLVFARADILPPEYEEVVDWPGFGPVSRYPCHPRAVWVAVEADWGTKRRVGGQLGYSLEPDGTLEVRWLYVEPEYRRRGVGTLLLEDLIGHYPDRTLYVFTRDSEEYSPARRLYEKMGFEPRRLPGFYGRSGGVLYVRGREGTG